MSSVPWTEIGRQSNCSHWSRTTLNPLDSETRHLSSQSTGPVGEFHMLGPGIGIVHIRTILLSCLVGKYLRGFLAFLAFAKHHGRAMHLLMSYADAYSKGFGEALTHRTVVLRNCEDSRFVFGEVPQWWSVRTIAVSW